jgi:glutamate synthase domain-containing protein 3
MALARSPFRKKGIVMIQLKSFRSLAVALCSAAAITALGGTAFADPAPSPGAEVTQARGAQRGTSVTVSGEVQRYVVGPLGHVRGFLLRDGTVVMVHGTAGDEMAKSVQVGESVRVEGMSPASANGKLVFRASVYGQHGQVVTAQARGSEGRDPSAREAKREETKAAFARLPEASASGTVQTVIQGRHGKVEGVVLNDGTSLFLGHGLAREVASRGVRIGDTVRVTGKGASYPLGTSVLVKSITFGDGTRFEARARGPAPEAPRT